MVLPGPEEENECKIEVLMMESNWEELEEC